MSNTPASCWDWPPKGLHRAYLVDPTRLNLIEKRGPSSAAAVQLCAGVVGGEAIKILLGRGRVCAAPYYHHFDAVPRQIPQAAPALR